MTGFESIFFDTSPFIYLIENHPLNFSKVALFLSNQEGNDSILLTSALSIAEFEYKPSKVGQPQLIDDLHKLLNEFNFRILDINMETVGLSRKLIQQYTFLKMVDALQLSAAINLSCNKFLTNDTELKKVKEIEAILINDLNP